jgi:hypothetical protein
MRAPQVQILIDLGKVTAAAVAAASVAGWLVGMVYAQNANWREALPWDTMMAAAQDVTLFNAGVGECEAAPIQPVQQAVIEKEGVKYTMLVRAQRFSVARFKGDAIDYLWLGWIAPDGTLVVRVAYNTVELTSKQALVADVCPWLAVNEWLV